MTAMEYDTHASFGESLRTETPSCAHTLVATQAANTPGALAVAGNAECLTYGELNVSPPVKNGPIFRR